MTDTLQPELVFGLVGPLGSNIEAVQESLSAELRKVGYNSYIIHLTEDVRKLIPDLKDKELETFGEKIGLMNAIVSASKKSDFLARVAIASIKLRRAQKNRSDEKLIQPDELGRDAKTSDAYQSQKTAYIVRQIKREQEASLLSKVYGKKFIQVSIASSEEEQEHSVLSIIGREKPEISQTERKAEARRLIDRDKEEAEIEFGQGVINVFHSGDVFVSGGTSEISSQISRFISALFGSNFTSPTKDEYGSFMAKAASLRTIDISRQVGAAITSEQGDIISLGCNEVPKPLGGTYWCDDPNPQRDMERGVEPNKLETQRVIHNFVHALSKLEDLNFDAAEILKKPELSKVLKDAFISDITEFGRITHAEMSALTDAARLGRATLGSTIYVTTFPCHNCAKHLIAAGIRRIVYIEPYAKSKAFELSGDALTTSKTDSQKVLVEHFCGIAPKRYTDIFEKPKKRRDDRNRVKQWHFDNPTPMVPDKTGNHILVEDQTLIGFEDLLNTTSNNLRTT